MTSSAPHPSAARFWKIEGDIPPQPVGLFYQLGLAANAVAMVLLPLLYLGLIGVVAWLTYRHATGNLGLLSGRGNALGRFLAYLGPIVIGVLTVLFMFKPLFARRPPAPKLKELTRAEEPVLFAFIDEICALVRAPRPRRVVVDMQVNASASFTHGLTSLFTRNLTLTIGLPLAAGLSAREFGGVLAHEFGHFAQGAGMRLTYVIRSLNAWFARLVYERDAWDEKLRDTAGSIDFRIGLILHLARLMIWLTRKVLWVFMYLGHGLSCFMLRQMEFDADYYEAKTSGSDSYASTASKLRLLGLGWQRTVSHQRESYQAGRLVDDLPGLASLEVGRIPPEVKAQIDELAAHGRTGWFDTHPSDADRCRAAAALQAGGVLHVDQPAGALFADFAALSRNGTDFYYREECEIDVGKVQLLPVDEVGQAVEADTRRARRLEAFFGPLLSIRSLVFLRVDEIGRVEGVDEAERSRLIEAAKPEIEGLLENDGRELDLARGRALVDVGYRIKAAEFGAKDGRPATLDAAMRDAGLAIAQHRQRLAPALSAIRASLAAALRLDATTTPLVQMLDAMETIQEQLITLRRRVAGLEIIFQQDGEPPNEAGWRTTTERLAGEIGDDVRRIQGAFGTQPYPFPHARGSLPLHDYLVEGVEHADHCVKALLRGQAVLERIFPLYHRAIAILVEQATPAAVDTPSP